ncbi:YicC family protein [Pusillimonas sp. DMV24BSW_D]|jgi:uncharacterized protein (TIGR00255 family)|uniref:YicC/YloC family endoribonuclease n=1 Tax=Neopusillimonas aestuarii TaxID=2716226 RepID=UPI00140ACE3B|nr:YicC/YloC family endoribonuclease [Pusillimonas sp. DMV24BSW_D]QIM49619.1 YicC family protein [Pusillimonas sp. DMV24BSW_D]|tara:strand:+ start:972 stop:1913 length:942 start_codon:yes stop_codon:yes gene_type:complete
MTIRSMTAYGTARAEGPDGFVTLEVRSVNSRYLDINFRLPDELRVVETHLREKIARTLSRGKVEIRLSYSRQRTDPMDKLDHEYVKKVAEQLRLARQVLPDTGAPSLTDLIKGASGQDTEETAPDFWVTLAQQALHQALSDMQANREREGTRLATMLLECADQIDEIVEGVGHVLPQLLDEHRQKLAGKLRETLENANPNGFTNISGEELTARIAQESALFSLRIDVAEELTRLQSHLTELRELLAGDEPEAQAKNARKNKGSTGKRLDFLFQEMNREANTLGSKAAGISVTRAAIDLKLLIEQMREQAQNIE